MKRFSSTPADVAKAIRGSGGGAGGAGAALVVALVSLEATELGRSARWSQPAKSRTTAAVPTARERVIDFPFR